MRHWGLTACVVIGFWSLGASATLRAKMPNGLWKVEHMLCNLEPANELTQELYTGPNSISVFVNGDKGAFIDDLDGCHKEIPLRFFYPRRGLVDASFDGPIRCLPNECSPDCGLDIPVTVQYRFANILDVLWWSSIGLGDTNCTKGDQENPILYTMRRK